MADIYIALKPRYATRRATDKVIFNEGNFLTLVAEQSTRHILSQLDTCHVALVSDGKYYPVNEDNYAEQFALLQNGEAVTVEADDDFGVQKIENFVSATESDVSAIQKDIEIYNGIISGSVLKVVDSDKCAIEAIGKNGYWICFKFDNSGATAEGYSELKLNGEDIVDGDNYFFLGATEEDALKAYITISGKLTVGDGGDVETGEVEETIKLRVRPIVLMESDATPAVEVNGVAYDTLEKAFAVLKGKGGKITVNKSITTGDKAELLFIEDGKQYTLCLKNNITITLGQYITVKNGSLNLTGNGTLIEKNPYFGPVILKQRDLETTTKSAYLCVGTGITLKGWSGLFFDGKSKYMSADVYGKCIGLNDGSEDGNGVYINGSSTDCKLNFYGSTEGTAGNGMYIAGDSIVNVSGATVCGSIDNSGIEMRAGTLNIEKSKIIGGSGEPTMEPNGNGTTSTNCAVAIAQHTTKKDINVSITSTSMTGGAAFMEGNPQKNPDATKQTKLWLGAGNKFNGEVLTLAADDCTKFLYGGTFTKEPAAKFVATGYEVKPTAYAFEVVKKA